MSDTMGESGTRRRRVATVSTTDAIVQELVGDILDGTLAAGVRLPEVELASKLGVSRQSLRSALAELVFRGLLKREPHHSVRVATMSRDDAIDIYRIRQLMEGEAVRWLAVTPESWPRLDAALEIFRQLPVDASWSAIAEADVNFHRATVQAVGSPRLERVHSELLDEMRLVLVPARNYITRREMLEEHERLADVIRRGDPDLAAKGLAEHLALWTDRLLAYLPEHRA